MPDDRGPHVVMLVRNPFTHDSRVEKEAATLHEAGYRVTVVADAAPGLPLHEVRDGTTVRRVPRRGPRIPGVSFLAHELRLARVLRRLRPDVLHAHDSNALVPVALAARRTGAPFVYDAHDLWLHRPRRQRSVLYHRAQNAWYGLIERLVVPRAQATLTVSPPIAAHLAAEYRLGSVDLVPNYPDRPDDDRRLELRQLAGVDVPADARIVLYLGGLMGGRGIESLVHAVATIQDVHLVLLGAGHLAADLETLAADLGAAERVHVAGPVPPDEVVAYARSADIGVSPIVPSCLNYRYSLPNKLFQYMAAAIPVVASDFPQVRDIVIGAGAGLVVDTTDPTRIATAVRTLLADRAAALEMGRNGRRAVEREYNWATSARALLEAYGRIVRGPASR
jgi:glycosyltransferase involved in cell wall biosynthesis